MVAKNTIAVCNVATVTSYCNYRGIVQDVIECISLAPKSMRWSCSLIRHSPDTGIKYWSEPGTWGLAHAFWDQRNTLIVIVPKDSSHEYEIVTIHVIFAS